VTREAAEKPTGLREAAAAVAEYLADPVRFAGPEVLEQRRRALVAALAATHPRPEPVPSALESACAWLDREHTPGRWLATISGKRDETLAHAIERIARECGWMPPAELARVSQLRTRAEQELAAHFGQRSDEREEGGR